MAQTKQRLRIVMISVWQAGRWYVRACATLSTQDVGVTPSLLDTGATTTRVSYMDQLMYHFSIPPPSLPPSSLPPSSNIHDFILVHTPAPEFTDEASLDAGVHQLTSKYATDEAKRGT